jgi:hypothetical protein
MKVTIGGLLLALVVVTAGCAQTIARHDVIAQSDSRIGRAVETARGRCRAQQPAALPSAGEYERCVLETLRGAELAAARE